MLLPCITKVKIYFKKINIRISFVYSVFSIYFEKNGNISENYIYMKLEEAKQQFIETWGTLGTNWGINRSMAQIHALLLVSTDLLSTDDIMENLQISRGNANMNLRALIEWGLIERRTIRGERVEFFAAEKDIWKMAIRILKERRKRELDPIKGYLGNLKQIDNPHEYPAEYAEFTKMLQDLEDFIDTADRITNKISKADKRWFYSSLLKFVIGK